MIIPKFTIDQNIINNEIKVLNNILIQQRCLKQTLALYLRKISEGIYNADDVKDSNSLISCLNGIQKSFDNIKDNINQIIELKKYIEKALSNPCDTNYFEIYNERYTQIFEKISEDNIFYYSFMESLLKFMEVKFPGIKLENDTNNKAASSQVKNTSQTELNINTTEIKNNEILKQIKDSTYLEKTLFVSEKNGNAILPYSTNELENYFSNYPEKYSSIQDIIDKEYTISTKSFHNASMSRFKETFNLARKSKLSFIKSLNLANELFFNTNVDPIIIRACNNINELYIYLSCLEDNVLNEFKCFKIIYEK